MVRQPAWSKRGASNTLRWLAWFQGARQTHLTPQGYRGPDRRVRLAAASSIPLSWRWMSAASVGGVVGAIAFDILAARASPEAATVLAVLTLCFSCCLLMAAACGEVVVWRLSGRAAHAYRLIAYVLLGMTCGTHLGAVLGLHFSAQLAMVAGAAALATGTASALAMAKAMRCAEVDPSVNPLRWGARTLSATLLAVTGGYGVFVLVGQGSPVLLQPVAALVMALAWALVALGAANRMTNSDDSTVTGVGTILLSLAAGMSGFSAPRLLLVATVVEGTAVVLLCSHALLTLRAVLAEEKEEGRELVGINEEAELAMTDVRYRLHDVVAGLAGLRTDAAMRALLQPMLSEVPEAENTQGVATPFPWEDNLDDLLQLASRQVTCRTSVSVMSEIAPLVESARRRGQDVSLSGAEVFARAIPGSAAAVLRTLLDNAARHARLESVAVIVDKARAPDGSPVVEIRVRDDGPGVGDHLVGSLFVPGVGGADGGQGLGLSSARQRAQASGGDLYLETSGERGACFVLRLPADEYEGSTPPAPIREADSAA